jgi:GNAT superfamily N-acetyltransferase
MKTPTLYVRKARREDIDTIYKWRHATAEWLAAEHGTDQWSTPYPREKLEHWVDRGETYMASLEPDGEPIATITSSSEGDPELWTPEELAEPARYVSKANVVREHAGEGVGTTLIKWTLHKAAEAGAKTVRIDVWTTNTSLHHFYQDKGFEHVRTVIGPNSGALFQAPALANTKLPVVELIDDGGASDEPSHDDPEVGWERLANDPAAWLAQTHLIEDKRSPWFDRGRFPATGSVRDYFLNPDTVLDKSELRDVLRALLPDGTAVVGSDEDFLRRSQKWITKRLASNNATEYERRLIRTVIRRELDWRSKTIRNSLLPAPVPDLTWIVDLVFSHPSQAFEVAHAYLEVHGWVLNDQVIDGIFDFMATVRCHFGLDSSADSRLAVLSSIPPRSLEYLVAALWSRMGYQTSVTKKTRDGGKDVIARREEPGRIETTLIECRQWGARIPVGATRELVGVMHVERANKGVIVAPGGFTEGAGSAVEYAASVKTIELVDGPQLETLMTERYGPEWPVTIDRYIQDGRRIADPSPGMKGDSANDGT